MGALNRTNVGGKTWLSVPVAEQASGSIIWLGFADPNHGAALVSTGPFETPATLIITSDAGETWYAVRDG